MATAAAQPLTLAEFLEWDDGTDTRYELARSDLVVMAVVRARHSRIVGNLARYRGGPLQPVLPPER